MRKINIWEIQVFMWSDCSEIWTYVGTGAQGLVVKVKLDEITLVL